MRTRNIWFGVRVYLVILIYLQVALLLAGNGVATFPWGALTLGPKEFVDQGIIFVMTIPGLLGVYVVNTRRRLESSQPTAKTT